MNLEEYRARFDEEPGYLDYARVAPIGRAALEEQAALSTMLAKARFGSLGMLPAQHDRMRAAVAGLGGFRPDQVVFQPSSTQGLMQVVFGLTGGVLLSREEFPSLPYAVQRAAAARGLVSATWLEGGEGRITPDLVRAQLTTEVDAVALSLVDYRTGHRVDLAGIREVIGDRLLIVDAAQAFGVIEAPYEIADVVTSGGQKWLRAGMGTGFLAVSDRARERITPVFSNFGGSADPYAVEVLPPAADAAGFQVSHADPFAAGRLAAAAEEMAAVGIPVVADAVAERVSRLIDLADEYALPVVSPRAEHERAGIVVVAPEPARLTVLAASLHNHGVTATVRDTTVRFSAHATVDEETFGMLRAALVSFATAL